MDAAGSFAEFKSSEMHVNFVLQFTAVLTQEGSGGLGRWRERLSTCIDTTNLASIIFAPHSFRSDLDVSSLLLGFRTFDSCCIACLRLPTTFAVGRVRRPTIHFAVL